MFLMSSAHSGKIQLTWGCTCQMDEKDGQYQWQTSGGHGHSVEKTVEKKSCCWCKFAATLSWQQRITVEFIAVCWEACGFKTDKQHLWHIENCLWSVDGEKLLKILGRTPAGSVHILSNRVKNTVTVVSNASILKEFPGSEIEACLPVCWLCFSFKNAKQSLCKKPFVLLYLQFIQQVNQIKLIKSKESIKRVWDFIFNLNFNVLVHGKTEWLHEWLSQESQWEGQNTFACIYIPDWHTIITLAIGLHDNNMYTNHWNNFLKKKQKKQTHLL